jgi:hypothetical protein
MRTRRRMPCTIAAGVIFAGFTGCQATILPSPAAAATSVELLHGWGYNEDFNGDRERTILTIKTFQPWAYGSFFLYYDITGPFAPPDSRVLPNEKGGFFGGISANFSIKRIGQKLAGAKEWKWGAVQDVSLSVQVEHVSKLGALSYFGGVVDIAVPHFDFVSTSALIRQDWSLDGVGLQLGGAWQITFGIGKITDVVFGGFFQWGVFGEGEGVMTVGPDASGRFKKVPVYGRPFFLSQPQLLLDVGKLTTLVASTLYAGIEYQLAWNRYLQQGVTEHVPQLMFKWAI